MERIDWITRFIHRMEQLDVRLRPGQLAEMAARLYETSADAEPEAIAEVEGKDGVRRDD